MANTDLSVKNQKVFVTLEGVLKLQAEINRLWQSGDKTREFVLGLERAAEIVGLPLVVPFKAQIMRKP